MNISEEMALRLHRMMWSDMQRELGDCPDHSDRLEYKEKWCETHFPGETIRFCCFLCDYCGHDGGDRGCDKCPIKWPDDTCATPFGFPPVKTDYRFAPISEILALPVRNEKLAAEGRDRISINHEDIFRTLAEASGLSAGNKSVKAHIYKIRNEAERDGRRDKAEEIFKALSVYSGVAEGNWSVYDHALAIMRKASKEKELNEAREKLKDAVGALNLYRSTLSYESNLPLSAPIADHIKQIREYSFTDGKRHERERIMDKIGEMLSFK